MKNPYILLKKVIIIIIILITTQACESIIEIDDPNNQIEHSQIYKDAGTTRAALSYLYTRMRDNTLLSKGTNGMSFSLSLYTDELDYYGSIINDFHKNSIQANNNTVGTWWNTTYQDIYAINAFIEGVSNSAYLSNTDKKQFLGESLVLRALTYQYLTQLFGDIPFTITTNYNHNTIIGKTNFENVLLEIEKDLLKAIQYLDYSFRNTERFYVNKTVAELILAENYLLQKKYDQAQFYSQKILDNNNYEIETDMTMTFKKNAKSTIWQISPQLNTNITPETTTYLFEKITSTSALLSENLHNLFEKNDLRLKYWTKPFYQNGKEFLQVYKYKNNKNNTDEYSIFFRIEHAYFLLAESLLHQQKTKQALSIINQIRNKRGLTSVSDTLSQQLALDILLNEINKEFFTEAGMRFFSLKRNQKLNDLIKYKINWKDYHSLFPIPEKQLQINKNMLPNNPGY